MKTPNRIWSGAVLAALIVASVRGEDVVREEFAVERPGGPLEVSVQSPTKLASRPMLLIFLSADRQSSMPDGKYGEPGRLFLESGNRVASFDLPAHGERVDRHGSGISGFAARVAAGEHPFDLVVADGRAVIDECEKRGIVEPGRVVVCGVSRGGYCALRLMAADERIAAGAALAPATDWRVVREFAAIKDTEPVAELALENFAEALAGRRVYVAIGNSDDRVGTASCTRFVLSVEEADRSKGVVKSGIRFQVVDDSKGHALASKWRHEGVRFLLDNTENAAGGTMP